MVEGQFYFSLKIIEKVNICSVCIVWTDMKAVMHELIQQTDNQIRQSDFQSGFITVNSHMYSP